MMVPSSMSVCPCTSTDVSLKGANFTNFAINKVILRLYITLVRYSLPEDGNERYPKHVGVIPDFKTSPCCECRILSFG